MNEEIKTGDTVLPGDKLGVIEEFVPGSGTYQEDGVIYAAAVGTILIDIKKKKVIVSPYVKPILPRKGDIVLGLIEAVEGKRAYVTIAMIGEEALPYPFSGIIFVRQATGRFLETIYEAFAPGDIVKAVITDEENGMYKLSTADEDLGVTQAFCSKCGAEIVKKQKRLKCSSCGSIEQRKVVGDYGMTITSKNEEDRAKGKSVERIEKRE
ncbi:MAG: exosome complex RNA-binding protein Csl4 [Candidatus Hodarchaeota archaeon]